MAEVIIACKTSGGVTMELDGIKKVIHGFASEDNMIMFEKGEAIGITYGVDKSFWDAWRTKFANHPLLANGFIYEAKSEASAKSQAKEMKEVKTGLEQKTKKELESVSGTKELKNDDVE